MKQARARNLLLSCLLTAGLNSTVHSQAWAAAGPEKAAAPLVPLPLTLPDPSYKGTPSELPSGPGIEPLSDKPRAPFLAPAGTRNVALHQKVSLSDNPPFSGEPAWITDGQKEALDDQVVEMRKGTRYAQVDLGQAFSIYAIVIWHDHRFTQIFHDVIVQVADDANFTQNVRTLFNNDMDNSSGLGMGRDREYFETREGKLIEAKGTAARYVRCYTKGSTQTAINALEEIEVYGLPLR